MSIHSDMSHVSCIAGACTNATQAGANGSITARHESSISLGGTGKKRAQGREECDQPAIEGHEVLIDLCGCGRLVWKMT